MFNNFIVTCINDQPIEKGEYWFKTRLTKGVRYLIIGTGFVRGDRFGEEYDAFLVNRVDTNGFDLGGIETSLIERFSN